MKCSVFSPLRSVLAVNVHELLAVKIWLDEPTLHLIIQPYETSQQNTSLQHWLVT